MIQNPMITAQVVIPTYLCESGCLSLLDNYKEMLIDSGYYTEESDSVIKN